MTLLYRYTLILILLFGVIFNTNAQVGIGTNSPSASAMLDVESSTKGFLYPRMSNSQMSAISSPTAGLTIYNTDASALYCYNGTNWVSKEDKVAGLFNAGTAVQLDNIRVRMPSSGNYSMEIATVSGTLSLSGTCEILYRTSPTATGGSSATYDSYLRQSETLTTTFINFWPQLSLGYHGTTQLFHVRDETNNHAYHIIFAVGGGYLKNFISIKRLY